MTQLALLLEQPNATYDMLVQGAGDEVVITVLGSPQPAGSKSTFAASRKDKATGQRVYTGKVGIRDGRTKKSEEAHKSWRSMVSEAAHSIMLQRGQPRLDGPLAVCCTYSLQRPAGHYGTGRNSGRLKPSAPEWPDVKPDGPKYDRSVHDSLTDAGVYKDDAQFVIWLGIKAYARDAEGQYAKGDVMQIPGVVIRVRQL